MAAKGETVTSYISAAPAWARGTLRELRRAVRAAAPKAKESISYHVPYYSQDGRLAYIAVAKAHCSFFWIGASDKKAFKKELAPLTVVGSTLRIPKGERVPVGVIKKIVRARVKANAAKKSARRAR